MRKMNRRQFSAKAGKLLLLALGIGPAIALEGCNVVSDLIHYIPVIVGALNAIESILGVLIPAPAFAIIVGIKGALADIQAAAVEYQADMNPADKATLWHRILTFLHDVVDNFQQFLDALAAAGPILGVIIGIVNVVLSTLAWFADQMPVPVTPMSFPVSLKADRQVIFITPVKRSIAQFKKDFNEVVIVNGHPEQRLN